LKTIASLVTGYFLAYAVGCASAPDVPGYPLYAASTRLPRAQVARVFGPIGWVDGRNVADLGDGFELLPGCHVVVTRSEAVESTSEVSVPGVPRGRAFALPMQAGFTYVVKRQVQSGMGLQIRIVTFADELDAGGNRVRSIEPAKSRDELAACRQEAGGT
jgi:hypothetical protein